MFKHKKESGELANFISIVTFLRVPYFETFYKHYDV